MKPIGCYYKTGENIGTAVVYCDKCSTTLNSSMCKYMRERDKTVFIWFVEFY